MGRVANKVIIGLTGNIATGKSVVRQMLQHLGAYTLDADALTHQAMRPNAPAYRPVVELFGRFVVAADGQIDRARLGNIVFHSPDALAALEGVVHPIVNQALRALIARAPRPVVVIEAIKLLESPSLPQLVDVVWVTNASPRTQLVRLMKTRKLSEAQARARMSAQNPQADKLGRADVVIQNDGSIDETWRQVQQAFQGVRGLVTAAGADAPTEDDAVVHRAVPSAEAADVPVTVRRGMPTSAEAIAAFLRAHGGQAVSRTDVMMAFGQKSFLLAHTGTDALSGVAGWQVENLITTIDDLTIAADVPVGSVVSALVDTVEAASRDLQSEVGFIYLPQNSPDALVSALQRKGYTPTEVDALDVPVWREAVADALEERETPTRVLSKRLRTERVMRPI